MVQAWLRRVGVVLIPFALGASAFAEPEPQRRNDTPAAARRRPPLTREVLDRYLAGDFDGAVRGTPVLVRFDTDEAQKWIAAAGRAATARRRLAAATFALEYSGARPHQTRLLLPWAREVLADAGPPVATEAVWLRASVALCEALDLWTLLAGNVPGGNHIALARGRFPGDPYLQLADALASEVAASRADFTARAASASLAIDRIDADVQDVDPARAPARREALLRAAALLDGLKPIPEVRAEALLRLGFVRLRLGDRDAALAQFDQVHALTREPAHRYLAHLFSGWALASAGRPAEAITSYRAALAVVPHAQSASVLLTALLVQNEQLAEAELVGSEFLAREAVTDDPWLTYFLGGAPVYRTLVLRLREALK
jgi:tetratricopeptide (TPR) repeat protein